MRFPIRKKLQKVMEEAMVWTCSGEECNGWMRPEYALTEQPDCPHCGSGMQMQNKLVPSMTAPEM